MRTPQRSFVVEFKSGRRPPKAGTNSIWGDTDLKAVAREVEDDTSHLFKSNEAPGTHDAGGDVLPDVINVGSASEHAGDLDVARAEIPSVNGAQVDALEPHEVDRPVVEAVAQVQESQPSLRPRATSKDAAPKRAKRGPATAHVSVGAHEDQNTQSKTAMDSISVDEVAALDTENQRLKRLLAKQLHAQNLQLRKMLERFDAI
ncbi:hypothetical protein HB780_02670 (plasmid) [Rhizobium lusitanum]|uniref:hypothetical protein n=1 Tax=Rhizobium lusitanum TaxID=293958 RepID=UPI00161219F4|nr:hypothetical protein [Rhizobium lusitanum]QND44716.1 hypothetical protein HB780_02670 [Rhizobium lusitanum]